ncbi:MAG: hypothetical protein FP815_10500 [Desulfobulbaceae bacterium]|nr:hypothetical protein [Desulfobulbaceae bacterium]
MKKRALLIVATLLFVIGAIAGQVYLKRQYLHDRIIQELERSLQAKVSIDSVDWRWLPAPGITITQLKGESESMVLVVPKVHLIISPIFFLSNSVSLFRAKLIDPDLRIIKLGASGTLPHKAMPLGTIKINNGAIHLPSQRLTDSVTLQPIALTGINGSLSFRADRGELTLSTTATFAQMIHLNGSIDLSEDRYQLNITSVEFDSNRLLSEQSPLSSLPKVSKLTFASHLEGTNLNQFSLHLASKEIPFTIQDKSQSVTVAAIDCNFTRDHDNFALDINTLSLTDPGLNLSGQVSRNNDHNSSSTPEWLIDLSGTEIDLAAVRTAVIARFPTHPIAQKICSIVGGGSATTARYWFKGKNSDFHHLQTMKIWAQAKDVPVLIPGVNLALDRASGPISIIDGQLTGKNLSADIDKSHGENGTLLLDLRDDHHTFFLDLDLSADLKNLKDVLTQIVHSPKFQKELSRFTDIDGLAKGHLRLGDDLHHIETHVDVFSMEGRGMYNRLLSPFIITAGSLTVAPKEVEWRNLRGTVGKQQITRSQGSIDWYDGIEVDLDVLDANLELNTLFEKGTLVTSNGILSVNDFFQGKLDSLAGKATITSTSFLGRIDRSEQWRFSTRLSASDLQLNGPQIPEVTSKNIEGEISQDQLRFTGIFSAYRQELFLEGQYYHHWFKDWQGAFTVDGDIGQELGEWIRANQFIPTALFPNLPFRLEKFHLTTPGPLNARGAIISLAKGSTAQVQVDIKRQPDQIIEKLTFTDGPHTGSLSYLAWPQQDNHSLLTWQGELNVRTINDLFMQQNLKTGVMQGSFTRLFKKGSALYNGEVQLNRVSFDPENVFHDLSVDTLRLSGDSHNLRIDQADLALADAQVHITGNVSEQKGERILDLNVSSPALSSSSLEKTIDSIKKMSDGSQRSSFRSSLSGNISFTIDQFNYSRLIPAKEKGPEEPSAHLLSITPFKGMIAITPAAIDLAFNSSRVCGLSIQGTWHVDDPKTDNEISFASGPSPLYFEHTLPCLGIKQSLILGPFAMSGKISGHPKNWRHGTITASSQEGLIKRMNLLSEIFTAVNFTDYFTWQDMPDMDTTGLAFNDLTINAHIENNILILDKTSIKGKGVNLTGRGTINLEDLDSNLTFFIAPFKMVDSIITGIPLIGKALGGPKESILTFPVKVTGNVKAPEVTALAPEAVGTAAWEMLRDTITLPFRIFIPGEK